MALLIASCLLGLSYSTSNPSTAPVSLLKVDAGDNNNDEGCFSSADSMFEQFICQTTARVRQLYPNDTNPYTVLELCASMSMINDPHTLYPCGAEHTMTTLSDFQFARIVYTPRDHTGPTVIAYAFPAAGRLNIVKFNHSWYV